MNVLVVKPSSLGDVVHTFPAVNFIASHQPGTRITWVVNDNFAEVVELCPDVDEVAIFRRKRWGRVTRWHEFFAFTRDLRRRKFDLVVDFQGLFRSGLISFLAGAPRRVGFAHAREGASIFYNEKILIPANIRHAVEKNLFLAASALQTAPPADQGPPPQLRHSHDGQKQADILFRMHKLENRGGVVAIAPAARWPSKMFPTSFFAKVIDRVAESAPEVAFWILGTDDEREIGQAVIDECHTCVPENMMGEANLVTLVELLRRSNVLLANDTGPMHLAAACGCPTVALFSSTNPELTGPYGKGHEVLQGACDAGPCMSRECRRKNGQQCSSTTVSINQAVSLIVAQL